MDTSTNQTVPDLYFMNKVEAKKKRTELNGKEKETEGRFQFVVTLGPDHRRYSKQTQEIV